MQSKTIVIDGKGHLMGRLASVVAKQLLLGQKLVVVRCEQISISGSMFRNMYRLRGFMGKTRSSNPKRGHIHYHNPARIFWRCVRGMTPHKTARGAAALGRLKTFEGVPPAYNELKMIVPDAYKTIRIKNFRKVTPLGDLAVKFGWTRQAVVEKLEAQRKAKSKKYYEAKKKTADARLKAKASDEVVKIETELAKYGY
uniref:60S ribosomal protein L13a n=1 Tax=Euplotes harpa TaxID=151035 RepID=A0A7S3JA77_9SPIT|mmetsp:Transcript_28879/g.32970  ORF Transcript_28879/g.32970 Transcript_28879/m.32970 type:complete len:198 (+) Transcript_28879:49-642(+)